MCKWYCTSEGPSTNLECLHCGVRYCGACLHGDAGKMKSLVRCAACGKKPRHKSAKSRGGWSAAELDLIHSFGQGASQAGSPFVSRFAAAESNAAWKGMLRPEGGHADDPFRTYTGKPSARRPARTRAAPTKNVQRNRRRKSITISVLPRGWSTAVDGATGRTYYYHASTRETSWEHPGKIKVPLSAQDQEQAAARYKQETARLLREEERLRQQHRRNQRRTREAERAVDPRSSRRAPGNIFDRLTDSSQYTGAHRHRFDAHGRGKGLAGRDRIAKGHGTVTQRF